MKKKFNSYVQSLETYVMFKIKETVAKITPDLITKNRSPISLAMGAPTDTPPKFVIEALKKALDDKNIHTYSNPKGEKYFRDACALRMKNRFGVEVNPNTEIFSLIGSKEGIANFIRAMINPTIDDKDKDIIMVPDPGYASYKEMIKACGGLAFGVPLRKENNFMPDMDVVLNDLAREGLNPSKIKALLINYPNNPLGATATKEYLNELVQFCKKHDILLISDLSYADIYFKSELKPNSILEIEGAKDIAVEFHSFSKPYAMTGWRLGWVCGNKEAISIFGKLKTSLDSGIFKALQKAGAEVLNSQEGDEYIKNANLLFEKKQKMFVEGLQELGWGGFNVPEASFYLWLPIPPKYNSSVEFTDDLMYKSGIITVPGHAFGKYGEGFFRVSIVCKEEEIQEVLKRMKEDGFYFK